MIFNTLSVAPLVVTKYPGVTAAYVAHLETIRILLNTAASEDAEISTADISDSYLGTPLDRKEYMRISLKHIPPDIQQRYNIACIMITYLWKSAREFMAYHRLENYRKTDLYST